ncbi:phage tail tape measure protein [Mammaliicoccus sciuri]|uniref:phage tail tape measure protein n=1 Tax=Mammaliicoccus sciuri TaxID=1296 RepID=UPI002B25C8EC|nr:phage tail tape measure protein [Mammaliicoccus sciuri]WQL34210.1 phage tail tape measure protein [Mammaliicoccus sciuri]WQL61149.1 phage tail tape measure protein [Mammaliicoccus sciuri]
MASNFNIGILSELRIDANSSKTSINNAISSIQKNINDIKVGIEVTETKTQSEQVRKSANRVINSLNSGKNIAKIKAQIEIDEKQALSSIKNSIKNLNSNLGSQKLKVNIDANVDTSKVDKATKAATTKAGKNKVNIEVENKPLDKGMNTDSEKVKRLTQNYLSLKNAYSSYDQAVRDANSRKKDNITYETTQIKNANNEVEKFTVTLRKYNTAREQIGKQTLNYKLDGAGSYQLDKDTKNSSNAKVNADAQQRINSLRDQEIKKIERLNSLGKINTSQANMLIKSYMQLNSTHNMTLKSYQQEHNMIQKTVSAHVQANKLLNQRQSLIAQIERNERRQADSIDKRATGALKKELNNPDFLNSKNAAYRMAQIQTQVRGITAEAERATRSQMGFVEAFRTAMVKFPVWMGATTLFFGAIRSGQMFIDTITQIDSQLITLRKVMPDNTNMAEIFNQANEAALNYGQTISGVLDVYAEFARQGFKGEELTQFGNAGLIAANVGEIDPKQASEYLTSMSAQWETDANQAMRQVDSLNEVSNNYATTVEKLAQGQAKAGSTAKSMGLNFDETNAVIGALTAKTKQSGDEIGNFMKAVLPKLYVGKGAATIEDLGINTKNSEGQLKGAMVLLEEVSQKIKGLDKDQQAAIIRGLGGTYHYQRMQVLLDDLGKADSLYKQIKDTSENSAGSAIKENATYMESIEAKANKAKVSIEQFAVAIGDAFLKSGILDGIRVFTDLMTGLTKTVAGLGSTAPLLGILGGTVALFSKNVRSGFESARQSIADYILKQNELQAVKMDKNFNGIQGNIGTFKDNQKGAASQLVFTEGAYDKQASQAKAATTSTVALSKAQKDVSLSSIAASGALTRTATASTASAFASRAASNAVKGLGLALKSLGAASVVGVGIMGLSFVLEKIVGKFNAASIASEEFEQQQSTMKQAIESMSTSELDSMVNSFDKLKSKIDSGLNLNNDELTEYKNVSGQLANIFPDLVTGENQYGTEISGNKALLDARIEQMRTQLDLQRQQQALEKIEQNEDVIKDKDKESSKYKKSWGQTAEQKLANTTNNSPSFNNEEINQINGKIQKIKDEQSALKTLEMIETQRAASSKAGKDNEVAYLDKLKDATNEYITNTGKANNATNAAKAAASQNFNTVMMNYQSMKAEEDRLKGSGLSLFNTLSSTVTKFATSGKQAQSIFSDFESTLAKKDGFLEKMSSYESAVQRFKEAQGTAREKDAIKELQSAYSDVVQDVIKAANATDMSKKAREGLVNSLEKNLQAESGLNVEIDKSGNAHLKAADATDKNSKATADNTAVKNENADAAEAQKEANEELGNTMKEAGDNVELINKAMGEMDEGDLKYDTLTDLVSKYGDEVLVAGQNEADMMDFLKGKRKEELNDFNKTMQAKMEGSALVYEQLAGQGTALAEHMMETYGVDMSNYNTLAQFKSQVGQDLAKATDKDQTKLINAIADYYGIDLSNYDTLAQKKEAVENKLLEVVDKKWLDHLKSLADNINSIFGELDSSSPLNSSAGSALSLAGGQGMPLFNEVGLGLKSGIESGLYGSFLTNDSVFKKATSNLGDLSQMTDKLGEGLDNLGSPEGSGGKAAKGAGDAGKSASKAAKDAEKLKKEAESAGVSVEKLYKTFQKQTYVADELSMALDKVNHQLEMQQLNTQKYATWSQKYRDSLRQENKLIDEKTKKLNEQIKSMEAQIAAGKVTEYGLVSSDVNVPYYKYTANNIQDGKTGAISSVVGSTNQEKVWNSLKSRGLTDAQVAGIMGNIERESKFNPAAKEVGGTGIGLVQWSFDRANQLKAFAKSRGKSWKNLQVQLDFLWHELNTSEISALKALTKATSATSAADIFQRKYERAGVVAQGERNAAAKRYLNQFKGSSGGGIVSGTAGTSVVNATGTFLYDKQFGKYNAGTGLNGAHYGRDLTGANINGKTVKAARAGVVTFSGWSSGGNTVSIFDGQNTYTYMHLMKPATVKKGQTVKAGQAVGQVGSTVGAGGQSTGPHLHVQVNKGKTPNGTYVNSFTGANAAIDAKKAGYLKVAGSSQSLSGLMDLNLATGNVSSDYVDSLNAAEEARLAQIEAVINEQNAAEAMKQKVDELKKTLMDKQLEQARNSNQKNENLYNIHKSHVEEYDHWRELQQGKSAKLEYELNKIEFEKGRNNQTWRDKNAQLQASKSAEQGFEQSKIEYINKAIKQNKKLFGKNTVYLDEFEKMKRDAQQTIRDIASGIQQANGEIAASIVDQILDDYDKAEKKLQSKIDSLGKKKQFLDSEDNSQAKTSIKYTKQQAEASTDLGLQIQFTVRELERQLKNLKGNYELQKRVKDRILELKSAYDDARLAAYQYRIEAADADIDRQLNANSKRLTTAQKDSVKADYDNSFISQEYQIDLWRDNQVDKLKGLNKERDALDKNKKELEAQLKLYKDMPTQARKIKDAIDEISNSVKENSKTIHQIRLDLSQSVINSIKTIYQKQLELASKAYDDEYKEYEKLINKKLKLIDEEAQEETYNKDIKDKTEELNKLRDEIAQRMGDDSLSNQKKLKELREQLAKAEYDYDAYIRNKEREERKKSLQEELEEKGEQVEKQKEDLNKAYTDLLEDTRKFNEIQEQLMEGQINKYKSLIEELTKYVNDNMKDIGASVGQNMLDALNETFGTLTNLTDELKKYEKGDNKVPNSDLKPTKKTEVSQAAVKAVNAIAPSSVLSGLSVNSPTLPKDATISKSVTNNNTTQMEALVNIQNFTGTKAEIDSLSDTLANEMRKRGLILTK